MIVGELLHKALPYLQGLKESRVVVCVDVSLIYKHRQWLQDVIALAAFGVRFCVVFVDREWSGPADLREWESYQQKNAHAMRDVIEQSMVFQQGFLQRDTVHCLLSNWYSTHWIGPGLSKNSQYQGKVRSMDIAFMDSLPSRTVMLLSQIAASPAGSMFWVDYEHLLLSLIHRLGDVKKCIFLLDALPEQLPNVREMLGEKASDFSLDGLGSLTKTLTKQSCPVHWLDGNKPHSISEELLTRDGSGWMWTQKPFESIETITENDISQVIELVNPLIAEGILHRRNIDLLMQRPKDFLVLRRDQDILATGALLWQEGDRAAQIACLAVKHEAQGKGYGSMMLEQLCKKAKIHGFAQVYLLTNHSRDFFAERGYIECNESVFPSWFANMWDKARRSLILCKDL